MSALIVNYYKPERLSELEADQHTAKGSFQLLLLSDQYSIGYAIVDQQKEVLLIREYQNSAQESFSNFIRQILTSDQYLQKPFQRVTIGVANKRISLVPRQIYDETQAIHYLENTTPIWATDQVLTDKILKEEIYLVYAYRKSSLHTFQEQWPEAHFHHSLSCYLQMLRKWTNLLPGGHHVFVNARHNSLYISLFRSDELVYANIYDFTTIEDFLYYIILIYKEFQLDTHVVPLLLTGKIDTGSRMYNLIYRYITNIYFYQREAENIIAPEAYPAHLYFDLFALHSCE